jgi:hypothetical protein
MTDAELLILFHKRGIARLKAAKPSQERLYIGCSWLNPTCGSSNDLATNGGAE